jgi:hypothetical protein
VRSVSQALDAETRWVSPIVIDSIDLRAVDVLLTPTLGTIPTRRASTIHERMSRTSDR